MNKDKITAEEFLEAKLGEELSLRSCSALLAKDLMIEFAKIKVKEALEAAAKNVKLIKECGKESIAGCNAVFCNTCIDVVNKNSILNAYNLEDIK